MSLRESSRGPSAPKYASTSFHPASSSSPFQTFSTVPSPRTTTVFGTDLRASCMYVRYGGSARVVEKGMFSLTQYSRVRSSGSRLTHKTFQPRCSNCYVNLAHPSWFARQAGQPGEKVIRSSPGPVLGGRTFRPCPSRSKPSKLPRCIPTGITVPAVSCISRKRLFCCVRTKFWMSTPRAAHYSAA